MRYEPVTIADLIAEGAELTAHCRTCGHHKIIQPSSLPERLHMRTVPTLEAVFRCSRCNGRDTCVMPLYASQKRAWIKKGEGWITPPAE